MMMHCYICYDVITCNYCTCSYCDAPHGFRMSVSQELWEDPHGKAAVIILVTEMLSFEVAAFALIRFDNMKPVMKPIYKDT